MPKIVTQNEAKSVARAFDLIPLEPYKNHVERWRCRCNICKEQVSVIYNELKKKRFKCPKCRQRAKEKVAVIEIKRAGFELLQAYTKGHDKVKMKCKKCGNVLEKSLNSIRGGHGCGFCTNSFAIAKISAKRLAEIEKKMLNKNLEPLEPYRGNKIIWKCRCLKCGKVVYPKFNNIDQGWGGCGWCSGRTKDTQKAEALMRSRDLEPLEPYPGTQKKWKCRHTICNRIVHPTYLGIQQGQGGCKFCSITGTQWLEPAVVYLLGSDWFQKIGIANNPSFKVRLKKHARYGLKLIHFEQFDTGEDAYRVEQKILKLWRQDLGAPPISKIELPDGFSETVENSRVSPNITEKHLTRIAKQINRR